MPLFLMVFNEGLNQNVSLFFKVLVINTDQIITVNDD